MYKPVLEILKKRQDSIKQGIKEADEAHKLLAQTETKEKEILKKAQNEAKSMLSLAKTQSAEMIKEAEESTRKTAEKMLQEAREQISYEAKETEKRLTAHVSQLAVTFLKKSLTDVFTDKEQEIIMQQAFKNLKTKVD